MQLRIEKAKLYGEAHAGLLLQRKVFLFLPDLADGKADRHPTEFSHLMDFSDWLVYNRDTK